MFCYARVFPCLLCECELDSELSAKFLDFNSQANFVGFFWGNSVIEENVSSKVLVSQLKFLYSATFLWKIFEIEMKFHLQSRLEKASNSISITGWRYTAHSIQTSLKMNKAFLYSMKMAVITFK